MKVSVIIPVYNVEPYVKDCLRSVMSQDLEDFEILCIEDCGTDGSKRVIKELMRCDSRIRLVENERNVGLAEVRNIGLSVAKGDYIYFLDGDDMIAEHALRALYEMAESDGLDVCIFAADFVYEDEALRAQFEMNPKTFKQEYPEVISGKEVYKAWMKVWDWMPSQPRYFYRRSFLSKNCIRFAAGRLHEDETFSFDVLMHAARVRVVNQPYFLRRFRHGSIMSSKPTLKNVEDCLYIVSHVSSYETDDIELQQAIDFYKGKLLADSFRKYKRVEEGRRTLFACSSYYHVLVSLTEAVASGRKADFALEVHGIETARELSRSMKENLPDCVGEVYVIPVSETVDPYAQKETAGEKHVANKLVSFVDGVFGGKFQTPLYDEICVFWDLGYVGTYLNIKGVAYTLLEDSLNSYQKIRENRPNYAYIFDEEKRKMHKGVVPFGYSPYVKRVEVNCGENLQIPMDKVSVIPRDLLFEGLSKKEKADILKVFMPGNVENFEHATLLLTEPFYVTGRLPNEESQVRLYEDLIKRYGSDGHIVIKAHPRDVTDYAKYFPKAFVMGKNIPMEVLNFDPRVSFDLAVTVTSSAVNGLTNVKEKVYLGVDFLKQYKTI